MPWQDTEDCCGSHFTASEQEKLAEWFDCSHKKMTAETILLLPFITMRHLIDSTGTAASKSESHSN